MASRFWTFLANMVAGQTARAEQVNGQFEGVDQGLASVEAEMNRAIRFTDGTPTESTYQIPQNTAQRSNLLLGFDVNGNLGLCSGAFTWRGDWVGGTLYNQNDMIRAPEANYLSLYVCNTQHVAGTFATDLSNGRWSVAVDLTQLQRFIRKFQLVTSNLTLAVGDDVFVDTSGGPITLTLPASAVISDQPISVCHVGGNNSITIAGNGNRIMGLFEDMAVNPLITPGASFELAFCDASRGWRLVKGT